MVCLVCPKCSAELHAETKDIEFGLQYYVCGTCGCRLFSGCVPDEQVMKQAAEDSAPVSIPKAEDWIARLSAVAAEITNFKIYQQDESSDEMVNLYYAQQQLLETIESMREVLPE